MRIFATITTHNRPELLARTVHCVQRSAFYSNARPSIDLTIYDDGSDPAVDASAFEVDASRYHSEPTVERYETPHGKEGYVALFNDVLRDARRAYHETGWTYWLWLQDDIYFGRTALARSIELLDQHGVESTAALNLTGDGPDPKSTARWTGRRVVPMPGGMYYAQWVDMQAILFTPAILDAIPIWGVAEFHPMRWEEDPTLSSGCGKRISQLLASEGYGIIMRERPIFTHDENAESLLNPHRSGVVYPSA